MEIKDSKQKFPEGFIEETEYKKERQEELDRDYEYSLILNDSKNDREDSEEVEI